MGAMKGVESHPCFGIVWLRFLLGLRGDVGQRAWLFEGSLLGW